MSRFSKKGPSQRQLRVGELVRHELTRLLQRGELSDPVLERNIVSVSEVSMSPDLKIATAFVSPLGGGDAKPVIKALSNNARYIRGKLAPALAQMKYMPEIRFREDTSFNNYSRIDELLHSPEVARDLDKDDGED
ncbi:MAG: 30S ribosome-binding factor RbfA [Rhizobiaceae bacterium]|jgi:ribosome-binding factor A|nr:30S ribosome-binding factor RbfA [Rhizobiaceae bacterium]